MAKRMTLMLLLMAAFLAVIGFTKYRQVQAGIAQGASFKPPAEAVTTVVAKQQDWHPSLAAIGSVAAVRGVTVSADLPGVVEKILFESGKKVRAGELLVQLDTRQEQAQLVGAQARNDLARLSLDRVSGLLDKGVTSQAEYDAAVAQEEQGRANVGETRAAIARKTIRAPFAGILGIRQANLGQYLHSGDPIVSLQAVDPIHVNFGVPQQEIAHVKAGREVRVSAAELPGVVFTGSISALDSVVDQTTRNIQVQALFDNPDGRLRPGMFVNVEVMLDEADPVVTIPASSISYAPYGNSVFIVEKMTGPNGASYLGVRQQFVKLGASRGDQVAVLTGVKQGEEVVSSGVFKLRNGAEVQVNNEVQPSNEPAPKPEDN